MAKPLKVMAVVSLLAVMVISLSGCGSDKTVELPLQRADVIKVQPCAKFANETRFSKDIPVDQMHTLNVYFVNSEQKLVNVIGDFIVKATDNEKEPYLEYKYDGSASPFGRYIDPVLYISKNELKLILKE